MKESTARNLIYVRKNCSRGRDYWYFCRAGERYKLPNPSEPNFRAEYDKLLKPISHSKRLAKKVRDLNLDGRKATIFHARKSMEYFDGESALRMIQRNAKKRATAKGLEFDLPPDWAVEQIEKQNYRCAISGALMIKDRQSRSPTAPSIDRKDSSLGYTVDNCQLVTFIVNTAKNYYTTAELFEMCKSVVKKNKL